jgi:hypothetical protein
VRYEPGISPAQQCRGAVYYDARGVVVTSVYVRTVEGRYPVAELDGIVRCLTNTHPGRTVALIAGGVEIVAAVPLALGLGSLAMLVVGVLAALGVAAGVLVDARRNPRQMELRASHRGADVRLFTTRDLNEFERVRWALVRAVEASRPDDTWSPELRAESD